MELRLFPVAQVYAGAAYFAPRRAADVLARYRTWIADAPDELSTAVRILRVPHAPGVPAAVRGRRVLALVAMTTLDPAVAERHLAPLRAAAGPVLHDGLRPVRFADAAMGGVAPRRLDLVTGLPDAAIAGIVAAGETRRSRSATGAGRWRGRRPAPVPSGTARCRCRSSPTPTCPASGRRSPGSRRAARS